MAGPRSWVTPILMKPCEERAYFGIGGSGDGQNYIGGGVVERQSVPIRLRDSNGKRLYHLFFEVKCFDSWNSQDIDAP
ncbi:hypothetical protein Y1Q_0011549 [Alligator mississippiensis]|uniref:Uncharacterized protein n=1 Tax=Alligator mississippiensis TaxID=8496 RepID=A0A151M064_ALLMI|nr:hypothetical protein Y1Q_0011549 [Alligator mississippiensis]